jgi:hypothetical protein
MPQSARDALAFRTEWKEPSVTIVRMDDIRAGWEQWFLIRADVHHDNPQSNRALEKRHLDQALERGAGILTIGDLFCAMQGKYDKRSNKSDILPEHQDGAYLDAIVRTAAEFYAPYAHNMVLMSDGNHETAIRKRHEVDLLGNLTHSLRLMTGCGITKSGYSGWVRFMFKLRGTVCTSRRMFYHHGYGGGGPVTLDMIQGQRMRAMVADADYIVFGHTHDSWINRNVRVSLTDGNKVEHRPIYVVKCPSYKDEYKSGEGGFHIETGKPPKPLGAWWLRFFIRDNDISAEWSEAT